MSDLKPEKSNVSDSTQNEGTSAAPEPGEALATVSPGEPLPTLGALYKDLFEMDTVEELSLSSACCYAD